MKPDKANPPGRSDAHYRLLWAVGFATMGLSFLLVKRPEAGLGFLGFALAVPLHFVHVWVHEGGHALMAWATGQRIHLVQVGQWRFLRRRGGWVRSRVGKVERLGGYIMASPRRMAGLRASTVLFCLGGVLGEGLLLLGILLFLRPFWVEMALQPAWSFLLLGMGVYWGALCVISILRNMVPAVVSGIANDGLMVFALLFRTRLGKAVMTFLRVAVLDMQGVRPRLFPPDLVADLRASSADASGLEAQWLLQWFLAADTRDFEALDVFWNAVQGIWGQLPAHSRAMIGLLHAWDLAALRGQAIPEGLEAPGTTLQDDGALLALVGAYQARQQGDLAEARRLLDAAMRELDADFPTGINEMYRESGMALAARLDAA